MNKPTARWNATWPWEGTWSSQQHGTARNKARICVLSERRQQRKYAQTQQFCLYTQKVFEEMLVHACSQQDNSQQPQGGNHPSVQQWVSEQNVVHPRSGIRLSHKKEGSPETRYNMDKPWKRCAERSETQKATQRMIPFKRNVQSRQIPWDRKQIGGCQGRKADRWREEEVTANGDRVSF